MKTKEQLIEDYGNLVAAMELAQQSITSDSPNYKNTIEIYNKVIQDLENLTDSKNVCEHDTYSFNNCPMPVNGKCPESCLYLSTPSIKKPDNLAADICQCGCERRYHGKSHSINFTEGKCSICKCENFVIKKPTP